MPAFAYPSTLPGILFGLFYPIPWMLFIWKCLHPRHSSRLAGILTYAVMLVPACAGLYGTQPFFVKQLLTCALLVGALALLFQGPFLKKLLAGGAVAILQTGIHFYSFGLMALATDIEVLTLTQTPSFFAVVGIVGAFLSLCVFQFLGAMTDSSFSGTARKDYAKRFALPLSQCITLFFFVNMLFSSPAEPISALGQFLTVVFAAAFVTIDLVTFSTFRDISAAAQLDAQNQYLQEENAMQSLHLEAMQLEQKQMLKSRAEVVTYIDTVIDMLEKNEIEPAKAYNAKLTE